MQIVIYISVHCWHGRMSLQINKISVMCYLLLR